MPDKNPGHGGQEEQSEPPVSPYLKEAKGLVDPHDFTDAAAFKNELDLTAARLEFDDNQRDEAQRLQGMRDRADARARLASIRIDSPSDEDIADEIDRNERENDRSGWN
jgi:hypothetical protein